MVISTASFDRDALRRALEGLKGRPIEPIVPLPRLTDRPFADAAVLIPIVDRPRPTLLFTVRLDTMRRHAGEISFPGGRADPGDADLVATALREAEEETGLPPATVEVLGALDRIVVGTGYLVTPVVGVIAPDMALAPHEAEVAALFEAPLDFVTDPANQRLETSEFAGMHRSFYVVEWQGHRIWGATARMLVELGKRFG